MKIAISSTGDNVGAKTHNLFGRCDFFLIVDPEIQEMKALKNEYAEAPTGAGTACAQMLFDEGVTAVISGHVGPKAFEVLTAGGVNIFLASPDFTVKETIERYQAGGLRKMEVKRF
jgi:predicted Fe-Mo cluster-binding NifX family protein